MRESRTSGFVRGAHSNMCPYRDPYLHRISSVTSVMLGEDVVRRRQNEVHAMDADGRLLWSVEFSKGTSAVAAHGGTLVCAADVLTSFRRRR